MSKESTLILLGILLIVTPFAGLPEFLRTTLLVVLGLAVVLIGISLKARMRGVKKESEVESNVSVHDQEIPGGQ